MTQSDSLKTHIAVLRQLPLISLSTDAILHCDALVSANDTGQLSYLLENHHQETRSDWKHGPKYHLNIWKVLITEYLGRLSCEELSKCLVYFSNGSKVGPSDALSSWQLYSLYRSCTVSSSSFSHSIPNFKGSGAPYKQLQITSPLLELVV